MWRNSRLDGTECNTSPMPNIRLCHQHIQQHRYEHRQQHRCRHRLRHMSQYKLSMTLIPARWFAMRDIFADDDLTAEFFYLTENATEQDRCYVYRIEDGKPLRPAILICVPYPTLFDDLRDDHGGGDFQVMIRRGETMTLSGKLCIATPIKKPQF